MCALVCAMMRMHKFNMEEGAENNNVPHPRPAETRSRLAKKRTTRKPKSHLYKEFWGPKGKEEAATINPGNSYTKRLRFLIIYNKNIHYI